MAYHYDKGGIFTKSDIGSYFYNHSSKHYALTEITPKSAMIPNTSESLTYTSFECVNTIQEDPYSASFVYNADNQRAKMEVKQNTTTILTRWYPESSYIKETASGTTKEYTFIGGDPYTAPVVAITQSGTTTYYYLLRDHLGSITHVVDATSGTLSYQYSYDAWGWLRNVSTWTNYGSGSEPSPFVAGRGFTGHEYLPWFNLINMNGRMYDPLVGQFLSPDNNIQDPYNSQNLNRYSYCLNNPLRYTDPTGFNAVDDFVSGILANGYNHWNVNTGYSTDSQYDLLSNAISHFNQYGWSDLFAFLGIGGGGNNSKENGGPYVGDKYFTEAEYFQSLLTKLQELKQAQQVESISPDGLVKYVNTNFGRRLPKNVSITWRVWNESYGLTETTNILNKNANITVSIPNAFLNDPTGFLYDCVDHEIVHINDFASSRASNWFNMYGGSATEAIMDYRAYSRNQWYSITYRNGRYDYTLHINKARESLPPGWE